MPHDNPHADQTALSDRYSLPDHAAAADEAARIIEAARAEAEQQVTRAREELRNQVAVIAVKGAEQILKREVNAAAHADLLNQLKTEL